MTLLYPCRLFEITLKFSDEYINKFKVEEEEEQDDDEGEEDKAFEREQKQQRWKKNFKSIFEQYENSAEFWTSDPKNFVGVEEEEEEKKEEMQQAIDMFVKHRAFLGRQGFHRLVIPDEAAEFLLREKAPGDGGEMNEVLISMTDNTLVDAFSLIKVEAPITALLFSRAASRTSNPAQNEHHLWSKVKDALVLAGKIIIDYMSDPILREQQEAKLARMRREEEEEGGEGQEPRGDAQKCSLLSRCVSTWCSSVGNCGYAAVHTLAFAKCPFVLETVRQMGKLVCDLNTIKWWCWCVETIGTRSQLALKIWTNAQTVEGIANTCNCCRELEFGVDKASEEAREYLVRVICAFTLFNSHNKKEALYFFRTPDLISAVVNRLRKCSDDDAQSGGTGSTAWFHDSLLNLLI